MRLPRPVEWVGGPDGFLRLLDQTRLPTEVAYLDCHTLEDVRGPGDDVQMAVGHRIEGARVDGGRHAGRSTT